MTLEVLPPVSPQGLRFGTLRLSWDDRRVLKQRPCGDGLGNKDLLRRVSPFRLCGMGDSAFMRSALTPSPQPSEGRLGWEDLFPTSLRFFSLPQGCLPAMTEFFLFIKTKRHHLTLRKTEFYFGAKISGRFLPFHHPGRWETLLS